MRKCRTSLILVKHSKYLRCFHVEDEMPNRPTAVFIYIIMCLLSWFSQKLLCNGENIKGDCTKQICDCVHTLKVSRGDLVELVLVNPRAEAKSVFNSLDSQLVHPMHIHGHSARVVTMLRVGYQRILYSCA